MILEIAGLCIEVESKNPSELIKKVRGLETFIVEKKDYPLLRMTTDCNLDSRDGKIIHQFEANGQNCKLIQIQDGYQFAIEGNEKYTTAIFQITKDEAKCDLSTNELQLSPQFRFGLWISYNLHSINYNRVSVHSSVVVHNKQAILFIGESGTGKSTQSKLWIDNIPNTFILNDDSPIIESHNNATICHGSLWSGKGSFYKKESYPVKAIIRIVQAKENKIERLCTLQSIAALHPSLPPSFAYQQQLYTKVTSIMSNIIEQVPIYRLSCLPQKEAALISHQTIWQK